MYMCTLCLVSDSFCFFFFKQKTAYELRISDWSSDVCSSDLRMASHSAARAKAGRIAKQIGGPVDLALAGAAPWDDRYITTASPSEHHASGYRLERLT